MVEGFMKLHWDILLDILPFVSDVRDICMFISTCKTLREFGIPLLLKRPVRVDGPVFDNSVDRDELIEFDFDSSIKLSAEKHVVSFFSLLLADEHTRPQLIRELFLHWDVRPSVDCVILMTRVFQNCTGLKRLWMYSPEMLLRSSIDLTNALAGLTEIEHIMIVEAGEAAAYMLTRMESPVKMADLDFELMQLGRAYGDPYTLCYKFRLSLTHLSVTSAAEWPEEIDNPQPFLSVTNLALLREVPDIELLLIVFPNVRRLEFDHYIPTWGEESRNENLETQLSLRWSTLDHLIAPIRTLYYIGVQSKVTELETFAFRDGNDWDEEFDMLHDVIRDTCPFHLRIMMDHCGHFVDNVMEDAFRISELRILSIAFCFTNEIDLRLFIVSHIPLKHDLMVNDRLRHCTGWF